MIILNVSVLYTEAFLFRQIGRELEKDGHKMRLFTEMAYARDVLKSDGADITLTRDRLSNCNILLSDEIRRIEARYGVPNLRTMLVGDRHFAFQPEDEGLRRFTSYIRMWEDEFEARPVDAVFMDFGGELVRRSLFVVARYLGIPTFYLNFAPFPRAIAWIDNEYNTWDDYEQLPHDAFSDEEQAFVDNFIHKLRSSEVQFTNALPLSMNLSRFKKLLEYYRLQREHEHGENHHFVPHLWLSSFATRRINRFFEKKYQTEVAPNERFVLFPLHVTDDAQLTVRASHIEQEELITQLSRSLPYGVKLYVKGHPSYIGGYGIGMLKRLSKLPNVRFIDPFVHAHSLLRQASAVATVNSTTGFESVVYGLPTIVFGPTYYRGKGLTYDVDGLSELPQILSKALREPSPASPNAVQQFLLNLYRATYPGSAYYMYGAGSQMTPSMLQENTDALRKNAEELANSIRMKLMRVQSRKSAHQEEVARQ